MEPIIDPMFFYWLGVVDSLREAMCAFVVFATILSVVSCMAWLITNFEIKGWKVLPWSLSIAFIFLMGVLFTPSSDTLIKMKVSENVTEDRLEMILEKGGDFKDVLKQDVIDIINAKDKQEEGVSNGE